MTASPVRVLAVLALAAGAASAQPLALSQLRAAAGPEAVAAWSALPAPLPVAPRSVVVLDADGRGEAASLCGRLPFDSDKNACLQQVSRARWMERDAADVCAALSFSSSIPDCLSAIADKAYLSAETAVCAKESFDDDKVSCLRQSGRASWGPLPGGDNREEAAAACGRAAFDSDRRECVQAVGRSSYFDRGAVGVCSALSFSDSYPKCFTAAADKEYMPEVLDVCRRESFDDGKIQCLQSSGTPWRGLPRWPYPGWPHPRRPWPPR